MSRQLTFLALAIQKKKLRSEKFLQEMNQVIPWRKLCDIIGPFYKNNALGRKPFELLLMMKIYCLQQWYQLSDPLAEESIYDRISFQKFLNLDLLKDRVPDETTILNFRHLLEEHNLTQKIFDCIKNYLSQKGLLLKTGTIVDATIISAPTSTKNKAGKRDVEMGSTCKHNQWYFGMKAHIGTDSKNGIVHSVEVSSASEHDKTYLPLLLHGEEESIFGDKAYYSEEDKQKSRDAEVFWGILDRSKRNHPLSKKQQNRNKKFSSIRSKIEHSFQVIKHIWGYKKTRYRGLWKNGCQLMMLFALSNIYRMRKKLIMA